MGATIEMICRIVEIDVEGISRMHPLNMEIRQDSEKHYTY
jgi:hypothetical protein